MTVHRMENTPTALATIRSQVQDEEMTAMAVVPLDPVHQTPKERRLRLRQAMDEVLEMEGEEGFAESCQAFLDQADQLDLEGARAVACLMTSQAVYVFESPTPMEPFALVSQGPYMLVLQGMVQRERDFLVAHVAKDHVELWQGGISRQTLEPLWSMALTDIALPDDLKNDANLQFYTQPGGGRGGKGDEAIYHGMSASVEDHVEEVRRKLYTQGLEVLRRHVGQTNQMPVVLMGEDKQCSIFRQMAVPQMPIQQGHLPTPPVRDPQKIAEAAKTMLGAGAGADWEARREEAKNKGLWSADVSEIGRMAAQGMVQTLLVKQGARQPGTYDPQSGTLTMAGPGQQGTQELFGALANKVMELGGEVNVVDPKMWSEEGACGAMLRGRYGAPSPS